MSFDPITLMTVGKFVGVGASIVSAVGNMSTANYNAAVAERNAKQMDENARQLAIKAQQDQQDIAEQQAQEKGAIIAEMGASGFDLSSGSSALQRIALDRLAQRDQRRTAIEGGNEVKQAQQAAADYRAQRKNAKRMGMFQLFSDLGAGFDSYISSSTSIAKAKIDLLNAPR